MEPILKIEHLSVYFTQYEQGFRFFGFQKRQLAAVKDLSLEIESGQIVAWWEQAVRGRVCSPTVSSESSHIIATWKGRYNMTENP